VLHRDVRMPRAQDAQERLKAVATEGFALGARLSYGA